MKRDGIVVRIVEIYPGMLNQIPPPFVMTLAALPLNLIESSNPARPGQPAPGAPPPKLQALRCKTTIFAPVTRTSAIPAEHSIMTL